MRVRWDLRRSRFEMRRAERWFKALLLCYPREFRDEYAGEMTRAFRDGWAGDALPRKLIPLPAEPSRTAPKEHVHVLSEYLRYALRTMRRAPMFSAAIILTVALAIGA